MELGDLRSEWRFFAAFERGGNGYDSTKHHWIYRAEHSGRLTDHFKKAIELAEHEARSAGASHVELNHLLLGIMSVRNEAAKALSEAGVLINTVKLVGSCETQSLDGARTIPFSKQGFIVIEGAWRLANQTGASRCGTEHLLLMLLKHEDFGCLTRLSKTTVDRIEKRLTLCGSYGQEADESIAEQIAKWENRAKRAKEAGYEDLVQRALEEKDRLL